MFYYFTHYRNTNKIANSKKNYVFENMELVRSRLLSMTPALNN